jgi:hypothetical protein
MPQMMDRSGTHTISAGGGIMKALSVRQPWAWLIVNSIKDVENRSWKTGYRGPFLVHASKTVDAKSWALAAETCERFGMRLPARDEVAYGAIVGGACIRDCVGDSESPWAISGHIHFLLADAWAVEPMEQTGRLGFFEVPWNDNEDTP